MKHNENKDQSGLSLSKTAKAFTLVEILGVIGIIAVVATLVTMSVAGSYEASQRSAIHKEEMELNRAWQHYLGQGGTNLHTVESGLEALAGTIELPGGIIQGPWISSPGIIPREMPVGQERHYLTFLGNEWRYYPQGNIPIDTGGGGTTTPTPEPSPEGTPDTRPEYTVTLIDSQWGGGAYSRLAGDYKVREGDSFSVQAIPAQNYAFQGWGIGNYDTWEAWDQMASPVLSFVVKSDQALTGNFSYSPEPEPTPEPTPEPQQYTVSIEAPEGVEEWQGPVIASLIVDGNMYNLSVPGSMEVTEGASITIIFQAGTNFRLADVSGLSGYARNSYKEIQTTFVINRNYVLKPSTPEVASVTIRALRNFMPDSSAGTVTVTPAGWEEDQWSGNRIYDVGQVVTISATPASGRTFQGWAGSVPTNATATDASYTIQQGSSILANFQ